MAFGFVDGVNGIDEEVIVSFDKTGYGDRLRKAPAQTYAFSIGPSQTSVC